MKNQLVTLPVLWWKILIILVVQCMPLKSQESESQPVAELPFEEGAGNKLFIKVRVNGSTPLWFVVDTGAASTHIGYSSAQRMGLTIINQKKVNVGAGGGQRLNSGDTRDVKFEVAGVTFEKESARVLQLNHVAKIMGRQVDGLLGNDFIGRYSLN